MTELTTATEHAWRLSIDAAIEHNTVALGAFNWPWALGLALDTLDDARTEQVVDSGPLTGKVTHADWQIVVDVLLGEFARLMTRADEATDAAEAAAVLAKADRVARIRGQIIDARRTRARAGGS